MLRNVGHAGFSGGRSCGDGWAWWCVTGSCIAPHTNVLEKSRAPRRTVNSLTPPAFPPLTIKTIICLEYGSKIWITFIEPGLY